MNTIQKICFAIIIILFFGLDSKITSSLAACPIQSLHKADSPVAFVRTDQGGSSGLGISPSPNRDSARFPSIINLLPHANNSSVNLLLINQDYSNGTTGKQQKITDPNPALGFYTTHTLIDAMSISVITSTQQIYLPLVLQNYPIIETGKIVFFSDRDGNNEIYSMKYDGTDVTRLTNNPSEDLSPVWSPDGSKIVFHSNRDGQFEIYQMNADGSGQTPITSMTHCYDPQWSPDGSRITFYTRQSNNNIINTMDPDGTNLLQVTDPAVSGYSPYWSPDGLRIAFFSARTTPGIYVIDADGTDQSLLLAGGDIAYFAWSPDGKRLALSKTVAPMYNIDLFVYDIITGTTTRLTNTTLNHNSVNWSPEGRYLIFNSNRDDINNFEIISMTSDGNNITNLTNNPAGDSVPDWTR